MEIIITPGGTGRCIYGEELDLAALGEIHIRRASRVEADAAGAWWADLSPVSRPKLEPFARRSQALAAEEAWLLPIKRR